MAKTLGPESIFAYCDSRPSARKVVWEAEGSGGKSFLAVWKVPKDSPAEGHSEEKPLKRLESYRRRFFFRKGTLLGRAFGASWPFGKRWRKHRGQERRWEVQSLRWEVVLCHLALGQNPR